MSYDEHFSLDNLPYGIASTITDPHQRVVATRLRNDVFLIADLRKWPPEILDALAQPTLNKTAMLPREDLKTIRESLKVLLTQPDILEEFAVPLHKIRMHLPFTLKGFTAFECSRKHLLNTRERLPPAFLHMPIGQSGCVSTVVPSGTRIVRPHGHYFDDKDNVVFGPSRAMDFELEMGCIIGKPSRIGHAVEIDEADEHIFGLVLINDWTARDLEKFETAGGGAALNSKSFGTTMSPWVVTLEALEPFACEPKPRPQDMHPASYLHDPKKLSTYSIEVTAEIIREGEEKNRETVCKSNLKELSWTFRDLVAHQSVNGCKLRTGDLLTTGVISGDADDAHGCLLEDTTLNKDPGADNNEDIWLKDGDEVRLTAVAAPGVGWANPPSGLNLSNPLSISPFLFWCLLLVNHPPFYYLRLSLVNWYSSGKMMNIKLSGLALLALRVVSVFAQEAGEAATSAPIQAELKADISTSFPEADIFGVKLVNGKITKALIDIENKEDGPIDVAFVGGALRTTQQLPEGAPAGADVIRNLTAVRYDVSIPAGEKQSLPFNFVLDMNPQDVIVDLSAVITNPAGQIFQVQVHSGPASIVEAPTSIFDPEIIFLYLFLSGVFGGVLYFKDYDESWIPSHHINRPVAKRVKSSASGKSKQ
ncbi:hypothetical protein V8F20_005839 [Naviculisporaceae sp. PSN 640]